MYRIWRQVKILNRKRLCRSVTVNRVELRSLLIMIRERIMRKYRKSLWERTAVSIAASSLFGSLCGMALTMLFSVFVYLFMDNTQFIKALALGTLIISGFCGAFFCGKHRRKHGLTEGFVCGSVIFAVLAVFSLVFTGSLPDSGKLIILGLSGAIGGVSGVNSRRPERLMN